MSNSWIQEAINEADQEFNDLEELEIPQLVRRNGVMDRDQQDIQLDFKLLEEVSQKLFQHQECPICLCEKADVPLKCGHTFCQNDISIMLENSLGNLNIISCPICRSYQHIQSVEELKILKSQMIE